jgi:hypothetical protein
MLSFCSPRIIPTTIPIGDARIKKVKVMKLETSVHFLPCERNVVPTEQATGILWITTEIAKTAMAPTSLKTPIASPSIKLCRVMAIPKATSD